MPSRTKVKNAAIAARSAALPSIPKELIDLFVSGPMSGEAVNAASVAFKKALIERAMGAELSHHLGYAAGEAKPDDASNHRNGTSGKTVLTDAGSLRSWKQRLYDVRERRIWPARDEKVLASWNGLMLRAMAEGARVFGSADYASAALRNGEFLWREMVRDGRVYRTHTRGETRIPGFLEDQASVALGFLALHQLTFDRTWFDRARELAGVCVAKFRDETTGDFYDTAADAEALVTRPRDITDNATPAGSSLAVELLLLMAELTGDVPSREQAFHVLDSAAEPMARYATMFGHLLGAADLAVNGGVEVALAGDPGAEDHRVLARAVAARYVPSLVLAGGQGAAVRGLALMDSREAVGGRATAYVCRHYACGVPTTDAAALDAQLDAPSSVTRNRAQD